MAKSVGNLFVLTIARPQRVGPKNGQASVKSGPAFRAGVNADVNATDVPIEAPRPARPQPSAPLFLMRLISLAFAFLLVFSTQTAWAAYVVQGKITTQDGTPAAGVNVVLIEQNPDKPPAGPLAMAKTQADGGFTLEIEEVDGASKYVVGTRIGQTRAASEPFTFAAASMRVDLKVAAAASPADEDLLAGNYRFEGRLVAEPGFDLSGALVRVVEMTINNPDGQLVAQGNAGPNGAFSIALPKPHQHSLYYLLAQKDARTAASSPKPLKPGVSLVQMRLEFLPVSQDPSYLSVVKNLFFFELLEDMVRVSEIILVENRFNGTLDLRKQPFSKQLPQGAENFGLMRSAGGVKAQAAEGQAFISLALDPGQSQVFYSYELDHNQLGQSLSAGLLPGTREIELVRTSEGFDVSFLGALKNNVLVTQKGHGKEAFFSKKVIAPPGTEQIEFSVDVELMPQKRLFYPATLLMVLLLSGLFWYVKIKPEKA